MWEAFRALCASREKTYIETEMARMQAPKQLWCFEFRGFFGTVWKSANRTLKRESLLYSEFQDFWISCGKETRLTSRPYLPPISGLLVDECKTKIVPERFDHQRGPGWSSGICSCSRWAATKAWTYRRAINEGMQKDLKSGRVRNQFLKNMIILWYKSENATKNVDDKITTK